MSRTTLMNCAAMGWLWLVGSIKLQVSFAKETYKRDDILQKRPIILSILLTVATPYWLPVCIRGGVAVYFHVDCFVVRVCFSKFVCESCGKILCARIAFWIQKQLYISFKEPYIPSKEPNVLLHETYILSKEPYIPTKQLFLIHCARVLNSGGVIDLLAAVCRWGFVGVFVNEGGYIHHKLTPYLVFLTLLVNCACTDTLGPHTLRHTATHCNALQHTATHCNALQHTTTHYNTLQHTAPHCNTLQHTATHCNTLQHTATRSCWYPGALLEWPLGWTWTLC